MPGAPRTLLLLDVTTLAQQEGFDTRGMRVLCEKTVADDFGFEEDGCRWRARKLISQAIGASRGYYAARRHSVRIPDGSERGLLHQYLRFKHVVGEEGFEEVMKEFQLSLVPTDNGTRFPDYILAYTPAVETPGEPQTYEALVLSPSA